MTREPVDIGPVSPDRVPSANPVTEPVRPVIPMLHTLYDYEERFK
jgi:hypothetical protein